MEGRPVKGGILSFDEMEIRHGLEWRPRVQQLIGCEAPIAAKDINLHHEENLAAKACPYVMTIFYTSMDGEVTVPLGYFPTMKAGEKWCHEHLTVLAARLEARDLKVWGTCSDGFSGSIAFAKAQAALPSPRYHLFDYVHVCKLLRNNLHDRWIKTAACPAGFGARTLAELIKAHPELRRAVGDEAILPGDKMKWEPVVELLKAAPVFKTIGKRALTLLSHEP